MMFVERDALSGVTTEWQTARQIYDRVGLWSPQAVRHALRNAAERGLIDFRFVPHYGGAGRIAEFRLKPNKEIPMPRKAKPAAVAEVLSDSLFNADAPTAEQAATGKAVAKRKPAMQAVDLPAPRVVPVTGLAEILAVVERLSMQPSANADVADRILAMQERLMDRGARLAFNRDFVAMQPELPIITRDGRIVVQEKTSSGRRDGEITQNTPYARWETIDEQIKPILNRHGFGLHHRISTVVEGAERRVRVTAVLRHVEGHVDDSCYFDLPADTSGSKNNAQAWASSVSYGKRHTGCAALNIITKGEDDDGKASGRPVVMGDPLTEEELQQLIDFAGAVQCPEKHMLGGLNKTRPKGHPTIDKLADLPRSRFEEAINRLKDYEAAAKAREQAK